MLAQHREIPGYHGVLTTVAFAKLASDPLGFFTETARTHGSLAWIRIGTERILLVSDAPLVDELLWGHADALIKDKITGRLRAVLGDGLLTSENPKWRAHRRRIAPSFQRGALASYAHTMVECTERAVEHLTPGTTVDLHHEMSKLTLDIVHRCLFGSDVEIPADTVGAALETMMGAFMQELRSWRRFVPESVPLASRKKIESANERLDSVILALIGAARARVERGEATDILIDRLLLARGDNGAAFTDAELRDEACTLFVAGHETTALALTFALTALSWHPHTLAPVTAELDRVLGGRRPTVDDLASLPQLRAVCLETLRLYPPAWGFGRTNTAPVTLDGHTFGPGHSFFVLPWILHRDPRRFDDPLTFRPARWLSGLEKHLPRGAFVPFGGGVRTCVGNHFAMMEMMLALAVLLQDRRLTVDPSHDLNLQPAVTLRPGGPVPAAVAQP